MRSMRVTFQSDWIAKAISASAASLGRSVSCGVNRIVERGGMSRSLHSGIAPVEFQLALAEGKALEMAHDGALQRFELPVGAGGDAAFERVIMRRHRKGRISRPIGAAGVLREDHRAGFRRKIDREVVLPVLAELLQIAAGLLGRHAGGRFNHHPDPCTWSGDTVAAPQNFQSRHSKLLPPRLTFVLKTISYDMSTDTIERQTYAFLRRRTGP